MRIKFDDLQLCDDCLFTAVNGDFTGLDYHYGDKADARMAEVVAGLESLGPHLVPNFDSETGDGIEEFSTSWCDCCGTHLAGGRHRFAVLEEGDPDPEDEGPDMTERDYDPDEDRTP